MTDAESVTCDQCGARREDQEPALSLAWVSEREDGRTRWLCSQCARTYVRDIESKLPSEYW